MLNQIRRLDCLAGRITFNLLRIFGFKEVPLPGSPVKVKKILCVKLWGLGNLALICPLIGDIKKIFPEARIIFLTFDLNRGFLENSGLIERVVYFKYTKNIFLILKQFIVFVIRFRKEKIDLAVNFETFNNASAIFAYLTRAPLRFGFRNRYEGIFYTNPVCNKQSEHISQSFLSLVLPLDNKVTYNYFNFTGSGRDKIAGFMSNFRMERYVCIHPGTSENFKGKRYRKDYFSELTGLLLKNHGLPVVFTGTEKETGLVKEIVDKLADTDKVLNLAGKLAIAEFIELLKGSFLFISNDSGPVHIAASLGINTVVFYGPTSPARYGPLNRNSLVFYKNHQCSPCVGTDYINKKCRNNFSCLNFSPQEVFPLISERFFHG